MTKWKLLFQIDTYHFLGGGGKSPQKNPKTKKNQTKNPPRN